MSDLPLHFAFTCLAAPVQAEGTVDGKPFYFRARNDEWTFSVAESTDVDPVAIDSPEAAAGRGWFRTGTVGPPGRFAASWLDLDDARAIIRECAALYLAERSPPHERGMSGPHAR